LPSPTSARDEKESNRKERRDEKVERDWRKDVITITRSCKS